MYHFVSEQTSELRLSESVLVSSYTTQYLKSFQLDAIRFLYEQLCKQEICIFNDESGLGKSAVVVALLNALGPTKKTLIVIQNDDQFITGWQFHFGVLSELPVCVIQNIQNNTDSEHSIYLIKWNVLRSIGDLSKLKFDHVIVDNRGHTLNNKFCTSMLLKHYERKVNIVISSVDITSDVKLLYNVLQLGGRLDYPFKCFKSFENKFRLPDSKDVFNKRLDLEDYYKQRGMLGEFVKNFRLRRYRHQFDKHLPLVTPEQYKSNLELWLAQNNNSNITLSGSSSDVLSTGNSEEIERLVKINEEHELAQNESNDKCSIHSDTEQSVIAMSPLVFEASDVEDECTAQADPVNTSQDPLLISSDDCEIITPEMIAPPTARKLKRNPPRKSHPPDPIKLKKATQTTSMRRSGSVEINCTKPSSKKLNVTLPKLSTATNEEGTTPITQQRSKANYNLNMPDERTSKNQKRELATTPKGSYYRETRSMQRLTRSADARLRNKYMTAPVALDIDKKVTPRRKPKTDPHGTPKSRRNTANKTPENSPTASQRLTHRSNQFNNPAQSKKKNSPIIKKPQKIAETKTKPQSRKQTKGSKSTQSSSSGSTISDIQCAQQMPDNLDDVESQVFRIPLKPQGSSNIQNSCSLSLCSDPEVTYLPPAKTCTDVIILSSSQDEGSNHSSPQSRRTRALKRKRVPVAANRTTDCQPTQLSTCSSFGLLLSQQRALNKSPDIFSNCSDISLIPMAQPVLPAASPFEGFKIFGSEVKSMQQQQKQQHTISPSSTMPKKKRDRSCLNLLEQMFEPRPHSATNVLPMLPVTEQAQTQLNQNPYDEDIFEISNNGEFGSRLRLNSTGGVSPVQQQQLRPTQHKITNYLIGTSAVQPEESESQQSTNTRLVSTIRKSPKGLKSTQSTKLTRWFATTPTISSGSSGESVSAPTTPVGQSTSVAYQAARQARSNGPTKRKRLELFK